MSLNTSTISVSGQGESTESLDSARYAGCNKILKGLFSKFNEILTDIGWTRTVENTVDVTNDTKGYYFREIYKYGDNTQRFLIVQISSFMNFGKGGTNDKLGIILGLVTQPAITGSTVISYNYGLSADFLGTNSASKVDNTYIYDLSISGYLLSLSNDTISLLTIGQTSAKTNFVGMLGIVKISNVTYIAYISGTTTTSRYLILVDKDGNLKYTNSTMIASSLGVNDVNYILTLPIYLSDAYSAQSVINKDLKLENALQTTNNACNYSSIYKIDDIDYFAIGNNFLVKM